MSNLTDDERQKAIWGRDLFNEYYNELRHHEDLKKIQDVMNRDVNKIIYAEPEPPIPVLDHDLTVHGMRERYGYPIYVSPFLIPTLLINKEVKREDLVNFANRMVNNQWGNTIRLFGSVGGWEKFWYQPGYMQFPYAQILREGMGIGWDCMAWHPDYDSMVRDRIEIFTDRHITVILSLGDNCSYHDRASGFWSGHPWNGKNNVNGTSEWNNMVYHYYEPEHSSKPGAEQTRDITNAHYKRLINLTAENKYVNYEATNEAWAGHQWHRIMSDLIDDIVGLPKWRKICSMNNKSLSNYKKQISDYMTYSIHNVFDYPEYNQKKALVRDGVKFIASQDGEPPTGRHEWIEDSVFQILSDGAYGFEQNLRPLFVNEGGKWVNLIREGRHDELDWTLTSLKWGWADAVRDGWFRFMGR